MTTVPLDRQALAEVVAELGFDVRRASIREMNNLVNAIEARLGVPFVRMEFGIPGLPTPAVAVDAEVAALRERKVGHIYAPFEGVPLLKAEAARFVDRFMGLQVPPTSCIPTVGAMQGCYASLSLAGALDPARRTVLFLDPGFPVNRLQVRALGLEAASIDLYDHRGDALIAAVEARVAKGDVAAVMWSSPNNPSWVCLKERELEGLGRIFTEHAVLGIEDLAYFGMDTRQDVLVPGEPPYQPTVLRYTDHALSIISASKMFSYAGQRMAVVIVPAALMGRRLPALVARFGTADLGHAFQHGALYPITACAPESTQYGLAALLKAANDGDQRVWEPAREYARRAAAAKALFLGAGFHLVYDNDLGEPLADGFYFTIAHRGFAHGAELLAELLHYGISAITLETAGSTRTEGLRACVSLLSPERVADLEARLARFAEDHPPS